MGDVHHISGEGGGPEKPDQSYWDVKQQKLREQLRRAFESFVDPNDTELARRRVAERLPEIEIDSKDTDN